MAVSHALRRGSRGLPGGSSLAQLLAEHRGKRNIQDLPPLSVNQILLWADTHHQRTGRWPKEHSGSIVDAPGDSWGGVENGLRQGSRGLPGGSSLARLLAERRGVRNVNAPPKLSEQMILDWADEHHQRTGSWPSPKAGTIPGSRKENWSAIDAALKCGVRGFPGGSSLALLLRTPLSSLVKSASFWASEA